MTRINRGGERKKNKVTGEVRAREIRLPCISVLTERTRHKARKKERERKRRIILFLHQMMRNSPISYDRLTASLVRQLFEGFEVNYTPLSDIVRVDEYY